jgi:hypothetical protein
MTYSRGIKMPKTRKEGLCNFVQMIINNLEAERHREALLIAADLLDTLEGDANPFASITADKDNKLIEELSRKHATEIADAIILAHNEGHQQGVSDEKARMARQLGLAA